MRGLTPSYVRGFRKAASELGACPDVLLKLAGPRPEERAQMQRMANRPWMFSALTTGGKAPPRSDDPYCGSLSAMLDSALMRIGEKLPKLPSAKGTPMSPALNRMRENRRLSDLQRRRDAFAFENGLAFDNPPVWNSNKMPSEGLVRK